MGLANLHYLNSALTFCRPYSLCFTILRAFYLALNKYTKYFIFHLGLQECKMKKSGTSESFIQKWCSQFI